MKDEHQKAVRLSAMSEFANFALDNSYPSSPFKGVISWVSIQRTNDYLTGVKLEKPHYL